MDGLWISAGLIFVAELGDRSQLMAMTLAARHRRSVVLAGIAIATGAVHLLSVVLGAAIGEALPARPIGVLAGLAFVAFGWWTWRGDEAPVADARRATGSVLLSVTMLFVLAELGDKTMLATVTLATEYGAVGTWLGSTVGMVAADALAIAVGGVLATRMPARAIRVGATALFVVVGVTMIVSALR